ncbi:MAG: hypothetical protein H6Q15_795 [Bacteroidetes bacterium]|nr:hypothetical protein [Bacteroidota bacterium]
MNPRHIISLFCFLFFSMFELSAQSISTTNITHNSATLHFSNPTLQQKNIHIFTKSSEDTLIFKEDFSGFPIVSTGNYFGGYAIPLYLPNSYTNHSGCQGRNLCNPYGDSCYFRYSSSNYSEFITPSLDLSKSGGNYRIRLRLRNTNLTNKINLRVYKSDNLGNFSDYSNIVINNNSSRLYDSVFSSGTTNSKIRFYMVSQNSNLILDDIQITYTSISNTEATLPISTNDSIYSITNLNPNTKYYSFIEGSIDTISFATLNRIYQNSISNISPNSAKINYTTTDTINQPKLIIRKKSNSSTVVADDLLISEYISTDTYNRGIEIYNGTNKNICLQDYKIRFLVAPGTSTSYTIIRTFDFFGLDTIYSNSTIVIYDKLDTKNNTTNGLFYKNTPLLVLPVMTITGNDAIVLLKNNKPIDIFGDTITAPVSPTDYWQTTNGDIKTNATIIKRKSTISKGRTINPNTTGPVLTTMATFLANEWDLVYSGSSPSAANLSGVGTHVMDNAYGGVDSLVSISSVSGGSYTVDGLEEGTYYEACLMIISGSDTTYSNKEVFKTGVNTYRTKSGNWDDSDTNWTKGIPTEIDNANILPSQIISIQSGDTARAYNIIINDSLNQAKAELINNGVLDIKNKSIIEACFKGYTISSDGWNLFGLPISASSSTQDSIGNVFFHNSTNDDLYYWQEDYTDASNNGRWVNWKDIPSGTGSFFVDNRGYLVAYKVDSRLEFIGSINDNSTYSLLTNASLNSPTADRGWHLCSNPYPFTLSLNQIQRTNISNPSILDPNTLNYTALDPTSPSTYKIAPFQGFFVQGFFVQASASTNALNIGKSAYPSKKTLPPLNNITLSLNSNIGTDKTKLIFIDSTSLGYDVEFDNRKIDGFGDVPEISTKYNSEKYAINAIPPVIDSLFIDLNINLKAAPNSFLKFEALDKSQFKKIVLFDKINNISVVDFKLDSTYNLNSSTWTDSERYQLRLYKTLSSLEKEIIKEEIKIQQSEDNVRIISTTKIQALELINTKGQMIKRVEDSNQIILPQKGVFVLVIYRENDKTQRKIINL